jgi:DNA polymerase-3 subunit gamma/tau
MLSTAAFNALLKTLEEPPPHAIFILATTEAHKIPATVLSRCQRHEFRRIPVADIVAHLAKMAADEHIQADPDALTLIARQSTGAMRDAISLLDQLASTGQKITLPMAQDVLGTAASQSVLAVVDALVAGQPDAGLDQIHAALDAGSDARQFARQLVDYLRDLLLVRMGNASQVDATPELRLQMARHAQAFSTAELLRVIRAFNTAASEGRSAWQPALPLEMAFVDALQPPVEPESAPPAAAVSEPPRRAARPAPPGQPASPPSAAPPASPSAAAASGEPPAAEDAQALSSAWPRILALVRQQNAPAYGVLNSCKSRYLHGNRLTLSFASDVLKAKMERPENLAPVQNALQQVFGREIVVQCLIDTARRDAVPPGVDEDGMVAAALRDLGGELVDTNG